MRNQLLFTVRGKSVCIGVYWRNEWAWAWRESDLPDYVRFSFGPITISIVD